MKYGAVSVRATIAATFSEKIFTNRSGRWVMLKDRRIHVNAVSPGLTETAGLNGLFGGGEQADATKDYLVEQIPAGRIGQPDGNRPLPSDNKDERFCVN